MLIVRRAQLDAFAEDGEQQFVEEMVLHLRGFAPAWCDTMREEWLAPFVQQGIARAREHGFTLRGPIRLMLELLVLFGTGLEVDPQYPWLGKTLRQTDFDNQMFRAGRLEYLAAEYLDAVHGVNNEAGRAALFRLEERLAASPREGGLAFGQARLRQDIVTMFKEVFPRKLEHVGQTAALALIADAETLCARVFGGGQPRAVALVAALKFSFGVRCEEDAAYRWIGDTLRNPRISNSRVGAASLERQALAWLKAVNGRARAAGGPVEGR